MIEDPAPGLVKYCSDALGVSEEDYIKEYDKFGGDFQRGVISEEEFWERMCGGLGVSRLEAGSLWADAFKAAYVPREEIFTLAVGLREKGYKTALLSNTEKPAMQYFHQLGYDMFDIKVFSCVEGTVKPEKRIYELTVQRLGMETSRSVYIDDKAKYVKGAQQAGLKTILYESFDQVKSELTQFGIKMIG